MRVIAGEFRSRRLQAPAGKETRPTSDKLRETLFNVLGPRVAGARFADLYAGSGAVGIEAISRGASFCYFAERAPAALKALQANLAALKIQRGFEVNARSVASLLEKLARDGQPPLNVVFLDPPYAMAAEYLLTLEFLARQDAALLAHDAVIVAEHARKQMLPSTIGPLHRTRLLEGGDAALSLYSVERAVNGSVSL